MRLTESWWLRWDRSQNTIVSCKMARSIFIGETMKRLHTADAPTILAKHRDVPLRVYIEDPVQKDRSRRARSLLGSALDLMRDGEPTVHPRRKIIELGGNGGDISGFFSWGHECSL